ncbi:MAG: PD40 domain-containing protein, partial [Ktedonobacteraceae bacterium]|nr:PD40 domain-containing protein [Ktedonobacteraceae bacterium]
MSSQGYIRFPDVYQDHIVFVSEDDLWLVSSEGGRAERLTAGVGEASYPHFSPDGSLLAFVGREEGPSEVFVMPAEGGPAQRLTYHAGTCRVVGWTPDGSEILYASNAHQFAARFEVLYAIKPQGGMPRQLPLGMANAISYGPDGGVVIGRNINITDYAHWKRYRGGRVGHLWCDSDGSGTFKRLLKLDGNVADPCWLGERIYFLSDHEGIGNLYSCTPGGEDVRRHTQHDDFYARHLNSDGKRLVYHAGADLYLYDPETDNARRLDVEMPSLRAQRQRKFVSPSGNLDTYSLHPQGHAIALTTRGKAFSMGNWEGPVLQHGEPDGVRYRFLQWLNDGKRMVAICDAPGQEALVVFNPEDASEPRILNDVSFGRAVNLKVSPTDDFVAITNHRNELIVVDLETGESRLLDHSDYDRINGFSWSPDGLWVAYGFAISSQKTAIKLCNMQTGETHQVTEPVLKDVKPSFDPDGKYLYFLGYRVFHPVYDNLHFDLGFPRGVKPYAIMLRRDQRSPFVPEPKAPGEKEKDRPARKSQNGTSNSADETTDSQEQENKDENSGRPAPVVIDLDGISDRVLSFPVGEGRYKAVRGTKGKALFLLYPVESSLELNSDPHAHRGAIDAYDFENYKSERLIDGVSDFDLSRDAKTLIYRQGLRLRAIKAGEKPPKSDNGDRPGRESGWLDLHRVKVSVQPAAEWRQMFAEAWRLQR